MRMRNQILIVLGCIAISVKVALAAGPTSAPTTAPVGSVTGTWSYTLQLGELKIDSVAELKQAGTKISGVVTSGVDTKGLELKEGSVKGQAVEFIVDRVAEVGTLRSTYRGKLDGDQIRGTVEVGWVDVPDHPGVTKMEWVAKRAIKGARPTHGIR